MKTIKMLALAAAATMALAAPAMAATITYTYTSTFTGTNGQAGFANTPATFIGVGDTNNMTTGGGGFPAVILTSFVALSGGQTFNVSTPFAIGFNALEGIAGFFPTNIENEGFSFVSPGLVGYDGLSNLAPVSTTPFFTDVSFQTDNGFIKFTGQGTGTFSAAVTAGAVPEPATWAMMIGGIGMVGGAMRRRRVSTKVSFA